MTPTKKHTRVRAVIGAMALLALSACGTAAEPGTRHPVTPPSTTAPATIGATAYPLTLDNCGVEQVFPKKPSRVVILNGLSIAEVESMIALGLDGSIVANAQNYGTYDEAGIGEKIKALPTAGVQSRQRDIPAEALLALKPDLVISSSAAGFDSGSGMATRDQLDAIGARTLISPDQCASGASAPTPRERQDLDKLSWASAKRFYSLLGRVFDVQERAGELNAEIDRRVAAVRREIHGRSRKNVLIAFPGMSMMNANGLPAVMTGGSYDSLLAAAGAKNSFGGEGRDFTRNLSAEQLAAASVDVLVLGGFSDAENTRKEAAKIFAAYPQWAASREKAYVTLADSVYVGPNNAIAIEKIARAVHPDAFQ